MIFNSSHVGRLVIRKADGVIFTLFSVSPNGICAGGFTATADPEDFVLAPTAAEAHRTLYAAGCKHIPGHGCDRCDALAVLRLATA